VAKSKREMKEIMKNLEKYLCEVEKAGSDTTVFPWRGRSGTPV
jgi:hypothetical protein